MSLKEGKSYILLEFILEFYKQNIPVLNYFISQKNVLSLRILDWLVTNYSKKNNICYTIIRNNKEINFNIFLEYKNQLKAYSKKLFDPFCRRERIKLNINDLTYEIIDEIEIENEIENENENENFIITTVGQLNFFKWFIENNVLEYAIENIKNIDNDMLETLSNNKKKKNTKRKELSICASKNLSNISRAVVVSFN